MLRAFITALLVLVATPLPRNACSADNSKITDADVRRLRPGNYIWEPWLAPDGQMTIVVNLHTQRASIYRDSVRIGATTVSTGRHGYRTPTGVFRIEAKYREHRSKKYKNAPMPYTQRFTSSGVALHGGGVPGYPSSHGCVHLPRTFAKLLFEETPVGTTVVVKSGKPAPPLNPDAQTPTMAIADTGDGSLDFAADPGWGCQRALKQRRTLSGQIGFFLEVFVTLDFAAGVAGFQNRQGL
jgi:hypothetical protein